MKQNKIVSEKIVFEGKEIEFEFGRFAAQTNAAVLARTGDTMVLATVVCGKEREDLDYFPLQVEYQEKLYAGGKIKGSRWVKREGRPSDEAILTARLIDRTIRPLFPKEFKKEIQMVLTVLSVDGENDADSLALCAASAALSISDIPFNGPVAGIRVGEIEGKFVANPSYAEREKTALDLVVSSTKEALVMVEAGVGEMEEFRIIEALEFGKAINEKINSGIVNLMKKAGKGKQAVASLSENKELKNKLKKEFSKEFLALMQKNIDERQSRESVDNLLDKAVAVFSDDSKKEIKSLIFDIQKEMLREQVLTKGIRGDGRKADEIRPLEVEVSVLARTHGSAVFSRGATQALSIVTLGPPSMEQQIESMEGEESKRYMHHYFFPPYSVGECGRMGWPSRREIGHGALAERALTPVLPEEKVFPYAIRVVSEIMSSNGSTSMASVCGSTLSLMDAGVPIKKPVAGIAMGLVKDKKSEKYVVLTDITGQEDHIGDMDFKVTGTRDGVTALQMDIKIGGVSSKLLEEALGQARKARLFILDKMTAVIAEPRQKLSPYAPQISLLQIAPDKIGEVIGPGGRMIRKITEATGTIIDIDDDGTVTIAGDDKDNVAKAIEWVEGLTREVVPGEVFDNAVVKRILDFGAFVEILPGKEGMVHVSKIQSEFLKHPGDALKEEDVVKVHVEEIDKMGRINLSMLFDQEGNPIKMPKSNNAGGRSFFRPQRFDKRRDFRR